MQTGTDSFTNFRNFVGVVEDRNDPQELGRVKVRVYSIHTENKDDLPCEDLPWAMVVQPITSAAISGVGRSPTGIVEGTWVYGVFLDEGEYQNPQQESHSIFAPSHPAQKERELHKRLLNLPADIQRAEHRLKNIQ